MNDLPKTTDAAKGRWRGILIELGIDEKYLTGKSMPCPSKCEGKDRFRFRPDTEDGLYVCHCTEGRYADGISLARCFTGKDFAATAMEIDEILGVKGNKEPPPLDVIDEAEKRKEAAKRIIAVRAKLHDKLHPAVTTYLNDRNIVSSEAFSRIRSLYSGSHVCMACEVRDMKGPISMHLTYLTMGGKRAKVEVQKRVMRPARKMDDCHFIPLVENGCETLWIAEGVETALSLMEIKSIAAKRVWSVVSSGGMRKFWPPKNVKRVCIAGDVDESFTGQAAAYQLAHKLKQRTSVDVSVHFPPSGEDFNEYLGMIKE